MAGFARVIERAAAGSLEPDSEQVRPRVIQKDWGQAL
jgi:hypothetical protein